MTVILVESIENDTFCARSLKDFEQYANTIFTKMTDFNFIPTLCDSVIIPKIMKAGDYFIVKESNFDIKVLNSIVSVTLYKIKDKETGWVRSLKIKESVPVKTITGTCIDMYDEPDDYIPGGYPTSRLERVMRTLPNNWQEDPIAVNFVNKISDIDTKTRNDLTSYINERMELCAKKLLKEDKVKIAIEIYEKLITKDGMNFIYAHYRFYNTCLKKICEFYYENDIKEMADYFETIYGSPITSEIARELNAMSSNKAYCA